MEVKKILVVVLLLGLLVLGGCSHNKADVGSGDGSGSAEGNVESAEQAIDNSILSESDDIDDLGELV